VLSGRGLCDELITRPKESATDCGASLCVIKKPRERGGRNPRWAAEPERERERENKKEVTKGKLMYMLDSVKY
jgi:hypothetical protein